MSNLLAKLFSGLTQEGVTLPNGQFQNAAQAEDNIPQLPDAVRSAGGLNATEAPSTVSKMPFLQASHQGPGGTPNAMAPQLSTKGKILTTLLSAAAGGAAAAGQRTVGGGFQSGMELPYQQAQMRQGAQAGQLNNQLLQQQVQYAPLLRQLGIMKSQADIGKSQAEAGKANAEAGAIPAKTALERAQTEAANYKDDPNMGLIDLRTGKPVYDASAPLSADEAQVLGKQAGERVPLKLKNTANEIATRGRTTINTEEGVFDYNRQTGEKTRLGANPRNIFAPDNRFVPVAPDPNNPGYITYERAGQAAKQGAQAPSSAGPQAAKATLKSATSGDIAKQSTAFQTAMQHADLLENATNALANGDTRALNSIKNRFKTEFGSPDATNWQAIANAYTREISAVLSKGHMTDAEIGSAGATLPQNASPSQIIGAIHAYKALSESKMNILKQQTQRGMQGQANFPAAQEIHYKIVNGQLVKQ